MASTYLLDSAQVFTIFFITLGPFKLVGPFAQATRGLDGRALRRLAWQAAAIGFVALFAGGYIGRALLAKWTVAPGAMQLSAGLIFFMVALQGVLAQYEVPPVHKPTDPAPPPPTAMGIAFPSLVTPYGIAAVILLLSLSREAERSALTLALLALVLGINLLAMLFVRNLMRPPVVAMLQVLGAVLGVMQVALSVAIMLAALRLLGVLPAAL